MKASACSLVIGTACALIWCAGCGGGTPSDREPTVRVSGTVTYNGQPVADASVALMPDNAPGSLPGQGKGAFGRTDSDGRFQLMTYEASDGAIPGSYKVTVRKYEGQAIGVEPSEEDYQETPEGQEPPPQSLLPEKYSNVRTTPLEASITEGKDVTLELVLED
jgi:hypothetical protein